MNYDKADLSDPLLKINLKNFGVPKGNQRPLPPGIRKRRYDKVIPIMTAKKTFEQFQEKLTHISVPLKKINKDINISKIEDIEKFLVNLENFQKSDWSSSLTHHDLETNILESSNGYKIIDWEYASNGHYSFDRHSLGLMNDNKMLNELIKFMNYFWSLINKKD